MKAIIEKEINGDIVILYIQGDLHSESDHYKEIWEAIDGLLNKFQKFVIDLSDVTGFGATALGSLMASHSSIIKKGGRVSYTGIYGNKKIEEKFALTSINKILEIFKDLQTATNSLRDRSLLSLNKILIVELDSQTTTSRKFADHVDINNIFQQIKAATPNKTIMVFKRINKITPKGIDALAEIKKYIVKKNATFLIVQPKSDFKKETAYKLYTKIRSDYIFSNLRDALYYK